jgi:protein TonB
MGLPCLAKPSAKSMSGIALGISLVIHAAVAFVCMFCGTVVRTAPLPSAVTVDVLTPPPETLHPELKPPVVRGPVPSLRPRKRARPLFDVQPKASVPPEIESMAGVPPFSTAMVAAPTFAPEPSTDGLPVVEDVASKTRSALPTAAPFSLQGNEAVGASDGDGMAEIARRLRSVAAGCYPYSAVRANLEGTTMLRFCIGEKGEAQDAQVLRSSGFAVLDNAAMTCILPSAAPFPKNSRKCVTVPVRFELQR